MALLEKVPQHIKNKVEDTQNLSYAVKEEARRLNLWKEVNEMYTEKNGTVDVGRAIATMTQLDQPFAEEFAFEAERAGYNKIVERIERDLSEGNITKRAAEPVSSTSFGGDDDLADQFVNQEIVKRIEADVDILQFVYKKSALTNSIAGKKSAKFPKWDDTFEPTPKAANAVLDDFTDDTTGGIKGLDNIVVEAEKIGLTMDFEAEAYLKLNPSYLAELITIGSKTLARGIRSNIYLGNGTSPNALGMWTNATAVAWAGNIITTIKNMIGAVGDADRADQGFFMITNSAGAAAIASEVANNESFNMNITVNQGIAGSVMGVPIIVDNSFKASGTSPNKTAPLYLGATGKYFYVDAGAPSIMTNPYSNFKAGQETARIMTFVGGRPAFNDSFAKTDIPNVY